MTRAWQRATLEGTSTLLGPSRSRALQIAARVPGSDRIVDLSIGQRHLLFVLHHWRGRRRATLSELARLSGSGDRRRALEQMQRLRQLRLVAYGSERGRAGGVHWWWGDGIRGGIATRGMLRRRTASGDLALRPGGELGSINVRTSPFGGFCTGEGWRAAAEARFRAGASSGTAPPGRGGRRGRSGGKPPRQLYLRCPAGHKLRALYISSRMELRSLQARYIGNCRICRRDVEQTVTAFLAPLESGPAERTSGAGPSGGTPAASPSRRQRELAAEILQNPDLPLELREALARRYLR